MEFVSHGDRTTTGGTVSATLSILFNDDGERIAIDGDTATCGNCAGRWPIAPSGTHMVYEGCAIVLHEDKVKCPCNENRVLASSKTMHYLHPGGTSSAASTQHATAFDADRDPVATHPSPAQRTATPTSPADSRASLNVTRCTLRIGVFFDGTLNNQTNEIEGALCRHVLSHAQHLGLSASEPDSWCKPYMLDPDSSYGGGPTNITRLYELYRDNVTHAADIKKDGMAIVKVYIDGIGTKDGQRDSFPGKAFGIGSTGVYHRVEATYARVLPGALRQAIQQLGDAFIDEVVFDVFGFSRGAAAARHFVNQLRLGASGPLAPALESLRPRLLNRQQVGVRAGFVGLFDTVPSIGDLENLFQVQDPRQGDLKLAMPAGIADKVVQLTARDEHRFNFALMTVLPQHEEIHLPGAHSDIGGGYLMGPESHVPIYLDRPTGYQEPVRYQADGTPYFDISQSRVWREAMDSKPSWQVRLTAPDADFAMDSWHDFEQLSLTALARSLASIGVYGALTLNRQHMDNRYALIPLRIMYRKAVEAGVPFTRSPDDVPTLALPTELLPIARALMTGSLLTTQQEALLRQKYIHISANWRPVLKHALGPDLVFINRPTSSGVREVHPNKDVT